MIDNTPDIMAFATKGLSSRDGVRLRSLVGGFDAEFLSFDPAAKRRSFVRLLRYVASARPDLVVMEGTGIGGGLACLLARLLFGTKYIVSSGDAIGPFVASSHPALGPVFGLYERLLCRYAAGFIGWTPYLVGRAMTFGVPRAVTAAGWNPELSPGPDPLSTRRRVRLELGIPNDAIVFGIVGSLDWNKRKQYCYGLELVKAADMCRAKEVAVLVVGGGSGLGRLNAAAGDQLGRRIYLPGPVPRERVIDYLHAMDVGSLPQSVDGVGSFRYTTKISEYVAARLPMVTGQIPLAYDLDAGWMWRLPGDAPWSDRYLSALAELMETISPEPLAVKRKAIPLSMPEFDKESQIARVTSLIQDVLQDIVPDTQRATTGTTNEVGKIKAEIPHLATRINN